VDGALAGRAGAGSGTNWTTGSAALARAAGADAACCTALAFARLSTSAASPFIGSAANSRVSHSTASS